MWRLHRLQFTSSINYDDLDQLIWVIFFTHSLWNSCSNNVVTNRYYLLIKTVSSSSSAPGHWQQVWSLIIIVGSNYVIIRVQKWFQTHSKVWPWLLALKLLVIGHLLDSFRLCVKFYEDMKSYNSSSPRTMFRYQCSLNLTFDDTRRLCVKVTDKALWPWPQSLDSYGASVWRFLDISCEGKTV